MIKRKNKGRIIYIRNLTPGVKNLFKAVCSRRGDTIQDVVEALLRLYTKNPELVDRELILAKQARRNRGGD